VPKIGRNHQVVYLPRGIFALPLRGNSILIGVPVFSCSCTHPSILSGTEGYRKATHHQVFLSPLISFAMIGMSFIPPVGFVLIQPGLPCSLLISMRVAAYFGLFYYFDFWFRYGFTTLLLPWFFKYMSDATPPKWRSIWPGPCSRFPVHCLDKNILAIYIAKFNVDNGTARRVAGDSPYLGILFLTNYFFWCRVYHRPGRQHGNLLDPTAIKRDADKGMKHITLKNRPYELPLKPRCSRAFRRTTSGLWIKSGSDFVSRLH